MYKILKIVVAILGLLGIVFLAMIMMKGDEAIKAASLAGDTSAIDPIAITTYVIFFMALAFVLVFVVTNLFTNTSTLKNTLIGLGAFLLVLVIAYFVSSGSDASMYKYNGQSATPTQSHLVGAGLIAFYILIVAAFLSMLWAGITKMTK